MKHLFLIIALAVPIIGIACDKTQVAKTAKTYKPIERIFMHSPGTYSFMVYDGNEIKTIGGGFGTYHLIPDVPSGMPMWATAIKEPDNWGGSSSYEIHIHDVSEVGGGSYRVGKSGEVQTVPLEKP